MLSYPFNKLFLSKRANFLEKEDKLKQKKKWKKKYHQEGLFPDAHALLDSPLTGIYAWDKQPDWGDFATSGIFGWLWRRAGRLCGLSQDGDPLLPSQDSMWCLKMGHFGVSRAGHGFGLDPHNWIDPSNLIIIILVKGQKPILNQLKLKKKMYFILSPDYRGAGFLNEWLVPFSL